MGMTKQNRNTGLFIGFLLLAGIANACSLTSIRQFDTLMTCFNYLILVGLLLFWIQSVRICLLPSRARSCVVAAALLMLLYMLFRIFKYRLAFSAAAQRYAVYAYWIPQMLIPALFLMTCILVRHGEQEYRKRRAYLFLIPAGILALLVMTNDLHTLVYVPSGEITGFKVSTGTYTYGIVFYLLYVWMLIALIAGLILLYREAGRFPAKAVWLLSGILVLWLGLVLLNLLVLDRGLYVHFYNLPEIHTFSMLGIFEILIRFRLFPYNENYSGFFAKLRIPSVITDRELQPVYQTETGIPADRGQLKAALRAPVSLTPDEKLYGREIYAGCAFWTEDESGIHHAQKMLLEANETIEQENDLIRAETEQKEKDAYLQSRHRIYHEIAGELYPVQKRIAGILDSAVPGTEDFKEKIAEVSVLNAYVKRKTNLLLLSTENEKLSIRELFLALQESANYLTLCGLQATAGMPEEEMLPSGRIVRLYDAFERIAEQLLGDAPSLMISWNAGSLRLAAETEKIPNTEGITLPVKQRSSDGILYIDVPGQEEAAV